MKAGFREPEQESGTGPSTSASQVQPVRLGARRRATGGRASAPGPQGPARRPRVPRLQATLLLAERLELVQGDGRLHPPAPGLPAPPLPHLPPVVLRPSAWQEASWLSGQRPGGFAWEPQSLVPQGHVLPTRALKCPVRCSQENVPLKEILSWTMWRCSTQPQTLGMWTVSDGEQGGLSCATGTAWAPVGGEAPLLLLRSLRRAPWPLGKAGVISGCSPARHPHPRPPPPGEARPLSEPLGRWRCSHRRQLGPGASACRCCSVLSRP